MKKAIYGLVFLSLYLSCSNKEDAISIDDALIGMWQVIEFEDDTYDPENQYDVLGVWEPVENGTIFDFKPNGELNYFDYTGKPLMSVKFESLDDKVYYYHENKNLDYYTPYEIDSNGFLFLYQFESVKLKRVID